MASARILTVALILTALTLIVGGAATKTGNARIKHIVVLMPVYFPCLM